MQNNPTSKKMKATKRTFRAMNNISIYCVNENGELALLAKPHLVVDYDRTYREPWSTNVPFEMTIIFVLTIC